jgi:transposase-like protein
MASHLSMRTLLHPLASPSFLHHTICHSIFIWNMSLCFCLIIPNLCHPILQINMVLKPWINKLKQIREGIEAYHCYKKQKFNLRVAYLWLVHDFVTYDIFSGWGVHGNLRCPICGKETYCFRLQFGRKKSYFDCHRHFLQRNHPLGSRGTLLRRILSSQRCHWSV